MSRHLFFTLRKLQQKDWSDAFPEAKIFDTGQSFSMPELDGNCLCWVVTSTYAWEKRITELARTGARVIALSENRSNDETFKVLASGGHGYASLSASAKELQAVALSVSNGGLWVGKDFVQSLIEITSRLEYVPDHRIDSLEQLTTREKEVATLVANGLTNKRIAQQLTITERTVKAHLGTIYHKTSTKDRLQLALLVNSQKSYQTQH